MASLPNTQQYLICPHCDQLLSEKAIKEHRNLFYDDERGVWLKISGLKKPEAVIRLQLRYPHPVDSNESLQSFSGEELDFECTPEENILEVEECSPGEGVYKYDILSCFVKVKVQ